MNASPEQEKIAPTRVLQPGDRLAFQVIPPDENQVVDMYYYEQVAGATYVTPQGQTVQLYAQGDIGQPPKIYFCFTQDSARNLYRYGALHPQPGKALDQAVQEWIKPETGKVLLYPGQYHAGLEWATTYEMQSQGETVAVLDVTYQVQRLETISISNGQEYEAFQVVGREQNGDTESITWFSTRLGVNIKKLS